ncbi:MAG: hypothetical protein GF317_19445 [Candidatus Lokiarchaeota archaeon]|nr:hypothetical protein [Candidatus Lokiarchaeota archaeon]MBD3201671.1 hypothetical protein [Candidatus Lokiarchaeota archaeon]
MELRSSNNIIYIAILSRGKPILILDFLNNDFQHQNPPFSRYISTISAFLNYFSHSSSFLINYEDIEISCENRKNISIIYAAYDVSQKLRNKIRFLMDFCEYQYKFQPERLESQDFRNLFLKKFADEILRN